MNMMIVIANTAMNEICMLMDTLSLGRVKLNRLTIFYHHYY